MAAGGKESQLKRRLIKEAIIAVVLLVILLAGAFVISNYDDDAQSEKTSKAGENGSLQADAAALQTQFTNGSEASKWYYLYIQNHNASFKLDREAAAGWLADLQAKYHLINLSLTISPITDVTGESFQLKTGKLVKSDVKITFSTISDTAAYNFMESLQRTFPGIVLLYDIKIAQGGDFPKTASDGTPDLNPQNTIRTLAQRLSTNLDQHNLSAMVDVQLSFTWLGIRSEEKPASPGGPPGGR